MGNAGPAMRQLVYVHPTTIFIDDLDHIVCIF
jgi:hypothetical protein